MSENDKSPEEIQAEIEETREDLGDTVAELADKADVKKQAGKKVDEAKQKAAATAQKAKETASQKVADAKEAATGKAEEVKATASSVADPQGGSGGDIGSGPTGDVRNSPGIVASGPNKTVFLAAGSAFLVGLALGWALWR